TASARIGVHRKAIEESSVRPVRILFCAIDQTWEIVWRPSSLQGIAMTETDGSQLVLSGDVSDPQIWRPALRRWVLGQGRAHLVPWLQELAGALGVEVKRTSIRCQRTRWGSYSSRGTVSLNAQLLFLPRELARYVLHHELCHAAHPDHSSEFWARLARFEPDARRLRARMRDGWKYVPGWLSRSLNGAE
ncbi:M48 family metallopeptidase, partial [Candidatus Bipolaricaulota bacterium]|nr:M48 family metallopeptidase [Candidatus Bipolaricaulota bacterium]